MAETWRMDDEEKPLFTHADKFLFMEEQKANSPRMKRTSRN